MSSLPTTHGSREDLKPTGNRAEEGGMWFLLAFFGLFSLLAAPIAIRNFSKDRHQVLELRDALAAHANLRGGSGNGIELETENGHKVWIVSPKETHPVPVATLGRDTIDAPSYGGVAITATRSAKNRT